MSDLLKQINNLGPILNDDKIDLNNVKKNEPPVQKNLENAKLGDAPHTQKKEEVHQPLDLKAQAEKVIVDNLKGQASDLARITSSAIRAGVPMEDIEYNLKIALKDKVVTEDDVSKILEIANMVKNGIDKQKQEINKEPEVKDENKLPEIKVSKELPQIKNKEELENFVKAQLNDDIVHGETVKKGQALDDQGVTRDLYEFKGICFRSDKHDPNTVVKEGGIKSVMDLSKPENMQEAMGLAQGKGATGKSGCSSAQQFRNCMNYLGQSSGRIYIIDTTKLSEKDHAYSMKDIILENKFKDHDESAGEVNITAVPNKAIIGWIKITEAMIDTKDNDAKIKKIFNGFENGDTTVEFNELYGK